MTNPTIRTIKRGDFVQAGYSKFLDTNEFLGFYTNNEGTGLGFNNVRELISNVADDSCYYAIFRSVEDGTNWAAYFSPFNGKWCVGSSADALKLAAA